MSDPKEMAEWISTRLGELGEAERAPDAMKMWADAACERRDLRAGITIDEKVPIIVDMLEGYAAVVDDVTHLQELPVRLAMSAETFSHYREGELSLRDAVLSERVRISGAFVLAAHLGVLLARRS